jgi:hypothetical protein
MRGRTILARALLSWLFASVFLSAEAARADEIRLKDGSKIIGTIVGFENDSFRVETSYGFALIRKDKVADINITAPKKDSEAKAKSVTDPESSPSTAPAVEPAVAKPPASSANGSSPASATSPMRAPVSPSAAGTTPAKADMAAPKVTPVAATASAPPVAPPAPAPAPEPPAIRDEVRGNQYVNVTYGFQMYKPPSWAPIPAARKALPDAVAALGTSDQTTLFVIGRATAKDSLDAHAAATEKALKDVYENYRLISTRHVTVAGVPGVEQRSRGTADGHDWSVILLTLMKDTDSYTLLGMTWAESDLIQVQENVIEKAVTSFTFVKQ